MSTEVETSPARPADKPKAKRQGPENRRRQWRFLQTSRVEYTLNGRRAVSFLGNLSLGGLFLRSADALTPGVSVEFSIFLEDGKPPLAVTGEVRECRRGG